MLACPCNAEATTAACGLSSHALVAATLTEIPALRDRPVPQGCPPLPPRFLRHCDEQTVVGIWAVLEAIAAYPEPRPSFSGYGVVAAPCQAGRIATAQSLVLARAGGGVNVSPHIVPQCSLHSLAGAVSVGLSMHGPNIGISGGQYAVSEGLFASLSLLLSGPAATGKILPGIWLVMTAWDREPALDATGRPLTAPAERHAATEPTCRGIAVALTPDVTAASLRISLHLPAAIRAARLTPPTASAADEILAFARALTACGQSATAGGSQSLTWTHTCPWAAEVRLAANVAVGLPQREAA
ncbi:MAG: hypothetical protein WCQ77_01970 [Planctomycetota bacterium]